MAETAVDEPPAAPVGVVLSGVALAAAVMVAQRGVVTALPPGAVGVAAAAVALGGFLARRHHLTSRRVAAPLALLGSVAVLGFAGYVLVQGDAGPAFGSVSAAAVGGVLGVVAGIGGIVAAAVDVAEVPRDRFWSLTKASGYYLIVGVAGLVGGFVAVYAIYIPILLTYGRVGSTASTALSTVGGGLGMLAVAVLYLRQSERDFGFIDLRRPSLRDLGYAVGGVLAIFVAAILVTVIKNLIGAESSAHSVVQQASEGNPEILLVLVPLSLLVIGPGEELLYRNVIQKGLYDHFSRLGALLIASVIFAAAHFTAYWSTDPIAFLSSLATIFALSLVLGGIYIKTKNILVPAFVHGSFNAIQFAALYVSLTTDGEAAMAAAALLV